jgi:NitT/TauT family transport system substrate-binding protein
LRNGGLRVHLGGGDAKVVPTRNADQIPLFLQGRLDGVWTVEPWLSRLELEAGAELLFVTPDEITTLLVTRASFLDQSSRQAWAFVQANSELMEWMRTHPGEAQLLVRQGLARLTRTDLPAAVVERAWERMRFDEDVPVERLQAAADGALASGLLRIRADLSRILVARPEDARKPKE